MTNNKDARITTGGMLRCIAEHPGQYLACRGLQTAAGWLKGARVEGRFGDDQTFSLDADISATVAAVAAAPAEIAEGSDAGDKAAAITILGHRLDWWLRPGGRAFKGWAGNQHVLRLAQRMQKALCAIDGASPFSYRVPMTGRFGYDPGAGWTSLDVGYSPDRVGIAVATFPVVELFAFIGLQEWMPRQVGDDSWEYKIAGRCYRFGRVPRGRCKALGWAEEVFDDARFRYVGPRW